eukprot:gene21540-7374_t
MEHVSATKKLLRPDVFDYDSTATSFPDASDIYANFMVHRTALVDHLTSLQPIDPDSKNNNNNNNGGNTGNGASSNGNPGNGTNSDDGVLPAQDKKKGGTVAAVVIVLLLLLLGGGGAYYYYYYIGRKRDAHEKSAAARNARKKKGHHGGHDFHDNPSFADDQDWSAESGTSANAETDDGELYTIYEELFGPTAKVGMSGAVGTSRATSNGSGTAGASIYGRVISDEGGDDYGDIDYSEHAIYSEGITFAELLKSAIDSTPPPLTSANPSTAFREAVTRAAKTCGDQNMDAKLIIDCIEYSVKFGEKVHRKQVQSGTLPHQSLTAMDIAVIHSYTLQTALYGALNKALREFAEDADYDIDDFLPYIALLIAALEKLPPLQTVVYRGIRKPAADLLGTKGDNDRFTFPAFTSTTLSPHVLMQPDFLGVDRRLEDAAAEGMLSHQQRKKPYVNLYGDGTAIGGGAIEYATAVDGVGGDGQELYHDVQLEQQRSAIESALYDGAKDAAASAATSSTAPPAIPLLPPKSPAVPPKETQPQTQLRCKKCKAKIQFCVCNVRRDSSAIIGKSNQQLQSGDPGKTCTYKRGACRSMQTPGPGPYCRQHTCAQCGKAKRSGDPACKQCAAGSDV